MNWVRIGGSVLELFLTDFSEKSHLLETSNRLFKGTKRKPTDKVSQHGEISEQI